MIGRLKTTTVSRHNSKINLLEKNEVIYREKDTLEQNQKVIMQQ